VSGAGGEGVKIVPPPQPVGVDEPVVERVGIQLMTKIAPAILRPAVHGVVSSSVGNSGEQVPALEVVPCPADHTPAIHQADYLRPYCIALVYQKFPRAFLHGFNRFSISSILSLEGFRSKCNLPRFHSKNQVVLKIRMIHPTVVILSSQTSYSFAILTSLQKARGRETHRASTHDP
jgi:hypothetical protein